MKPPVDTAEAQADIRRFLRAVGRRETARRLIDTLCAAAGIGLLATAFVVVAGRTHPPIVQNPALAWWSGAAAFCIAVAVAIVLAAPTLLRQPAYAAVARRIEKRLPIAQTLSTAVEAGDRPDADGPITQALLNDARAIARATSLHEAAPIPDRRTARFLAAALTAGILLAGACLLPAGFLLLPDMAARIKPDAVSAEATSDAAGQRKPSPLQAAHDADAAKRPLSAPKHPLAAPMPSDTARGLAGDAAETPGADGQDMSSTMPSTMPSAQHGQADQAGTTSGNGDDPLPYRPIDGDMAAFGEIAAGDPTADGRETRQPTSMNMRPAPHGQPPAGTAPPPAAIAGEGAASTFSALRRSAPGDGASTGLSGRGDGGRRDSAFSPTGAGAASLSPDAFPEPVSTDERLEIYATTPNEGRRVRLYVEPQAEREARRARLIDANTDTGEVWPPVKTAPVSRQAIARERTGIVERYLSTSAAHPSREGAGHPSREGHGQP